MYIKSNKKCIFAEVTKLTMFLKGYSNKGKTLILIGSFCACLLIVMSMGGEKETIKDFKRSSLVKLYQVEASHSQEKREFPGIVKASQEAKLSFEVRGLLEKLAVNEGQNVKKGQLLAKLDDKELRSLVKSHKAKYNELKKDVVRAEELKKQKFISNANYERRITALDMEKSAYEEAKRKLESTALIAPFSGQIAKTYVNNHQRVNPLEPILTMYDLSNIDISIQVSEQIISDIVNEKDKAIFVKFGAQPNKKYEARYKEHSSEPDKITKTYEVTLTLEKPSDFSPLPGMSANIDIYFSNEKGTNVTKFLIPTTAIFSDENNYAFVWTTSEKGGKINKQEVKISRFKNQKAEILSGLNDGDVIVATGARLLDESITVKPFIEENYGG
jgi:RND family efflux transporter MFP subunit